MRHVHGRQQLLQIRAVESALTRFFKHRLARLWRQSRHDVVARFTGNEDAPHRARVTDTQRRLTTLAFGRRAVREIRAMGFFRMDNGPSEGSEAVEELPHRRNNRRQRRYVVPQGLAKSPWFEKVALHINHHERQAMQRELIEIRGGGNGRHGHLLCVLTSDARALSSQLCRCPGSCSFRLRVISKIQKELKSFVPCWSF